MKRIAILLAVFGSACASTPVTTTHPLDSPKQYLVSDGQMSALILDGDQGFEVVARRDGTVISSGQDTWVLETKMEDQPQGDCGCFMEAFQKDTDPDTSACSSLVSTPYLSLTRLRDGKTVRPFESMASAESESSASFTVNGIVENKLLLETCVGIYSCGAAHPSTACEAVAIDLATGEKSDAATLAGKVDMKQALATLLADKDMQTESTEDLEVKNVRVKFSGSASFVEALVVAPACYACSDGEWSAYSVGTWQAITPSEELPPPVAAYFAQTKESAPVWTQVTPENRNAIEAAFAK